MRQMRNAHKISMANLKEKDHLGEDGTIQINCNSEVSDILSAFSFTLT
jgi:hypothetical protein